MYHYDPKGLVTNKLRLDRGAGQESETQKREDKTTFICPGIGAALPDFGTSQGAVQWCNGRSSLGTCGLRSDDPVGPRVV
jgi:hypothetical protein